MAAAARKRIQRELAAGSSTPELITSRASGEDLLTLHYVLRGPKDTPFEGGLYHGLLKFPDDYPLKPPGIIMLTPSGRFECGMRLCLSMSDYHPELWQPIWSHDKILLGLLSFMAGEERSTGTIVTTDEQKRAFAAASMAYNLKSKDFVRIFPELAAAPPSPQPAAASPSTFRSVALQFLDVGGGGGGGGGGEGSSGSASPRYLLDLPQGMEAQLRAALPTHPDFPKPGILFIDVLPLWRAPALLGGVLAAMAQGIAARFPSPRPAFLAGLESRGFLLAPLALQLGLPFLCVRKAGKLPGPTERLAYALEYGEAVLEVQRGVVEAGAAGLLCDDLLATGGTLKAARALLERLGARVLGAVVLVELVGLKGAQNLALPVLAALTY